MKDRDQKPVTSDQHFLLFSGFRQLETRHTVRVGKDDVFAGAGEFEGGADEPFDVGGIGLEPLLLSLKLLALSAQRRQPAIEPPLDHGEPAKLKESRAEHHDEP